MKYFTKDWYIEMQVSCFLVLAETGEDWDEELEYHRKEGKDLRKLNLRNLDDMWKSLLRYLLKSFHPFIHNDTLVTEYPTPKLRVLVNQWEREYERRKEELSERYKLHFEYRSKLSCRQLQSSWWRMACTMRSSFLLKDRLKN